jgi:hypothetical protein
MGPKTKAYKIPIHHSLTLTQTKNKQSHQPLGKTKSKKFMDSPQKNTFLVLSTTFFKRPKST